MPCGGIYPGAPGLTVDQMRMMGYTCWLCNEKGALHYLEEWDAMIHARCAIKFLADGLAGTNPEAAVVLHHEHDIYLDFSIETQMKQADPDPLGPLDDDPFELGPDPGIETLVEVD